MVDACPEGEPAPITVAPVMPGDLVARARKRCRPRPRLPRFGEDRDRATSAAQERGVPARGEADARLEMPSHVALVSEASGVGGVCERGAAGDLGLHPIEAPA